MPRKAREKSKSGIYHIMMRGINRQRIFQDDEDNRRFLQTIERYKDKCGYEVFAYCLMGNHVHLLLKIGKEPLEQVMRRLCGSYVYWYNSKYDRIGNLFQDRFKSEVIEGEAYFMTVLRYIHQNPIKAGIEKDIAKYRWSSYREYVKKEEIVDVDYTLKILNNDRGGAIKSFIKYNSEHNRDICLDVNKKKRVTDERARDIIKKTCHINNVIELQTFDILTRNKYLKELKERHSLSVRQIERLTGISRGVVQNA